MKSDIIKILKSWKERNSRFNSTESLIDWIAQMNKETDVQIQRIDFTKANDWYFNEENGYIENHGNRFFSVRGIKYYEDGKLIQEQPIICQPEIGYLGIICKEFDGVMHFLMQAKVEPGNVNCVQISPTIQATKSNFEQAHGGRVPYYFSYFKNAQKYEIIFDQIQSEQGMRFYRKRNRNIMIRVDEEIEVLPAFRWMTLGQIKELMKLDNLVNMDTRTVLSCIPFSTYSFSAEEKEEIKNYIEDKALFASMFSANIQDGLDQVFNYQNDIKMFRNISSKLSRLDSLETWTVNKDGVFCEKEANFDVGYYDIAISGREVKNWKQPLVCAKGMGTFGMMLCHHDGMLKFLVAVRAEIGAFDKVEIGPSVFLEPVSNAEPDFVERLFEEKMQKKEGILKDSIFSEEGGRFYHEQNRNVIMMGDYIEPEKLPRGYFWLSFSSLNSLIQINNCLNIQLRNLLSIIDVG